MDTYDRSTDPDDNIENIEAVLDWRRVRGAIMCKLFSTMLKKGAMTWYKSLPPQSIDSCIELCRLFTAYFTSSRKHPLTVAALEAIVQKEDEHLRDYIDADVRKPKHQDEAGSSRRGTGRAKEKVREPKAPQSKFTAYTPLNASIERILEACDEIPKTDTQQTWHGQRQILSIPKKPRARD
jgi:hypothetical protein